ncbi:M14 family metallopeptidase [Yeosuana sp. MJ-SS3]|uniref:M14 family metallopeptidase n=1 Tax=Gilvirhabdus luticola TaxID=3079858 RepID=A0ABU3U6Y8_9FLAO|nr:M14 family metallopeptidase [Yeosuana sp. MJ-SS3]MDU8886161.1 M14 family metallopeptidase [Yeosuana sp. MJ-SS3]
MQVERIKLIFNNNKERTLFGRYISNDHILPLLEKLKGHFQVSHIGNSVNEAPIYSVRVGQGKRKILMWSQMHGNESTTTKAIFDLLNAFANKVDDLDSIVKNCTLLIIPILNPDGAKAYTRVNANQIDLNRDAQDLSQPESIVLRKTFEEFQPNFCFNLHGQRTIFGAGNTSKSATVSFLAPSQDEECTVTTNRKIAMEVICEMNGFLQIQIPNQIGIYDDTFNINCVGDTFQNLGVSTILFEAGHYANDYDREITREFIFQSYIIALSYIANNKIDGNKHSLYFDIPLNQKNFFDIIIKNALIDPYEKLISDVGILYKEELIDGKVNFTPKIEKISNLENFYGHKFVDANGTIVETVNFDSISEGYENDFVLLNREYFSLKLK